MLPASNPHNTPKINNRITDKNVFSFNTDINTPPIVQIKHTNEPTLISIPPRRMTYVSPVARIAFRHICPKRLIIFAVLRNVGLPIAKATTKAIRTTTTILSLTSCLNDVVFIFLFHPIAINCVISTISIILCFINVLLHFFRLSLLLN